MINIVNLSSKAAIEKLLSLHGLSYFCKNASVDRDYKVYGCGAFVPGESYDEFVRAYSHGEMLGIIGLTIEEDILNAHEGGLRQELGRILMHAPKIFTTDAVSVEWAPHYDIQGARHGGHPAWLAGKAGAKAVLNTIESTPICISASSPIELIRSIKSPELFTINDDGKPNKTIGIIAVDLGGCILGALLELPVIVMPDITTMGHKTNAVGNHPMVRWAQRFNKSKDVVVEPGQLTACWEALMNGEVAFVDPRLVEAAAIEAYSTLEKMLPQPAAATDSNQIDDALAVFGSVQERVVEPTGTPKVAFSYGKPPVAPTDGFPKVISHGDTFDPTTHYDQYYYGDGPGLLYQNAEGEKVRYSGPGRDWEGFDTVGDIFRMIFHITCPTLVSLGCGFGNDVKRFRRRGWDAWGCDISTWSVNQAEPEVRDYIILGNVMDRRVQEQLPKNPSIVCTFDFWEHIWTSDIDVLLQQLYEWMQPGSFMANIICTLGRHEKDITIHPGDCFTPQNSWFLISGHVTGRRWHWWANKFAEHGFEARLDKSYMFQVARSEDPAMSQALSWRARNLLIVERK